MLYLRKSLLGWAEEEELSKSDKPETKAGSGKPVAAKAKAGELRGGRYAARVQTGYEKDGSPKYRYFKTEEEYSSYLSDSKSEGKSPARGHDKGSGKLESKVKEEHEESTKKHRAKQHHGLLSPDKEEKPKTTAKSLRLYVRT